MAATVSTSPQLPEALTGHAGYLSVVMGQRSQDRFETAIAQLELRPIQYDYLATLSASGPMAQNQLAALLEVDAARIVSLTDELQARSLVERTVDPGDRRRNLLSLTRAGRALNVKAARLAAVVEDELLSRLDPRERVQLRALLRKALDFG